MSGFLDRMAARAVGEAPLVSPRIRSRHEPGAGALPGEPVAEVVEERIAPVAPAAAERAERREERTAVSRIEEPRTLEPEPRRRPERSAIPPAVEPRANLTSKASPDPPEITLAVETPRGASPAAAPFLSRNPHHAAGTAADIPGGDAPRSVSPVGDRDADIPRKASAAAPPRVETRGSEWLSLRDRGDDTADRPSVPQGQPFSSPGFQPGVGERAVSPPTPPGPSRPAALPESAGPEPPSRRTSLRPIRGESPLSLPGDLPTVEADRRGTPTLPLSIEDREPSETVVHVSIERIDVRAAAPAPVAERRPARPAGPRLSLGDYLKRREERRR